MCCFREQVWLTADSKKHRAFANSWAAVSGITFSTKNSGYESQFFFNVLCCKATVNLHPVYSWQLCRSNSGSPRNSRSGRFIRKGRGPIGFKILEKTLFLIGDLKVIDLKFN